MKLTRETERLTLVAMSRRGLQAWLEADAEALLAETGAVFDEPVAAPPLFDEDLPMFVERMTETPGELGWWVWLVTRRRDRRALGVTGLGGRPLDGKAVLGYSIYPDYEGHGYATEASRALVQWVFDQPGMRTVGATIPVGHEPSLAVARKIGMVEIGRAHDDDVGEIAVYEIERG